MIKSAFKAMLGMMLIAASLLLITPVQAQELRTVENFTLKDAQTGEEIALEDYADKKAVVVVFTSSHCSFAIKYQQRLNKIFEQFEEREVAFLAINSNDSKLNDVETFARMRAQSPYEFPYLKDSDQAIAKAFKATRNPEAFVLIPANNGKFQMTYRGQIDDNPLDFQLVEQHFLRDALTASLEGKQPTQQHTEPSGCNIKWK